MFILSVFFLVIIGIYALLIIVFSYAFVNERYEEKALTNTSFTVSVIVAFRNETENLVGIIDSLLKQNYAGNYEIVLINDHSEDNFLNVLSGYNDKRIKIYNLPVQLKGKKAALRYAVSKAEGEILLFTDADCLVKEKWIEIMVSTMLNESVNMVCGPVEFSKSDSVFTSLFQLEFMSLTGSGAAGIFLKTPFICNGANYAVTRSVLNEAMQNMNDRYSSGDDVFLLHYVSRKYKVKFVKSYESVIETHAPQSLTEFFNQRVRWASKTSGYRNFFAIFVAIFTFLSSLTIVCSGIVAILNHDLFGIFAISFLIKFVAELLLLLPVSSFYKKMKLLICLPVLSLLHPFYVLLTALASLFYKPLWKGRRIS